ncbi:MAG TPA: cytochrome c [Gemmatimonadales bacterium]|nr:cytochrome c [Gemmatimonadales bacterium]
MATRASRIALPALLLPLLGIYGGWAAITVEDLPDYGVVRQPLNLTFTVRQHGVTKLSDLEPRVEARTSGATAAAVAERGKEQGQYSARLVLPQAGEWTITIHSGFGTSRVTLVPMQVIEATAQAPAPLPAADRGLRLFVAKGCLTCHLHGEVKGSGVVAVGPELTNRRLAPEYLQRFLADPSMIGSANRMPNLNLKQTEIAALIAFLSQTEHVGAGN